MADPVFNVTLDVLQALCSGLTKDPGPSNIIVAVIAAVGSLLVAGVTFALKMPRVKAALPGISDNAKAKKQLHDTIAQVVPMLNEVKTSLSQSASDHSDKQKQPL